MHTHKVKVTIPGDHHLSMNLPDNFPTGPAEVIVHSEAPSELPIIKLAGVLAPSVPPVATADDPIANALEELREERRRRRNKIMKDVEGREEPQLVEYVTDAHSLLWHLYRPQRLGRAAQQAFSASEAGQACIHVPAVVVAEALMVVQKGRLPGVDLSRLLPHIQSMNHSRNYSLLSLTPATVIASHQYVLIPDIFDRLIVTESILLGFPLLTNDPVIYESGLVSVVWD